jgi:hypothetical protein
MSASAVVGPAELIPTIRSCPTRSRRLMDSTRAAHRSGVADGLGVAVTVAEVET